MHGLPIFFHHIVGNIHQIVDGTDSTGGQTALHPLGRRCYPYIRTYPSAVAHTQILILYLHADIFRYIPLFLFDFHNRHLKGLSKCCRRFPGYAQHTVTIYSVGRNLIFKYRISQSHGFHSVRTYPGILRENIDAVFRRIRIHRTVASQLFNRAHHTCGRYAPQFPCFDDDAILRQGTVSMGAARHLTAVQYHWYFVPFFYIGCTRHNLNGFRAHIHLTYNQFIRIGMFFNGDNLANYNFFQIFVQPFHAFHFRTGQCHGVKIFLIRAGKPRHICFNPG